MKKFIFKSLLFTGPFLFLYLITYLFYVQKESPDLLRMGYLPNFDGIFFDDTASDKSAKFELLSKSSQRKFNFLTIGDSFSDRGANGYNSMLADKFSVLQVDRFICDNQIQTLINMMNGDFFSTYKIDYVILENIERHFIDNVENINLNDKLMLRQIDSLVNNHHLSTFDREYDFFSRTTLRFPYYGSQFFYKKNYLSNELVYNVETKSNVLFKNGSNKLLFYIEDLSRVEKNNSIKNAENLNNVLNYIATKLKEKKIKLIVLPAPDKYDMYYEYIVDKQNFKRPIFFSNFEKLDKNYIYIDSKTILTKKANTEKEIYLFGDTHWSSVGAKLITNEIVNAVSESKSNDELVLQ